MGLSIDRRFRLMRYGPGLALGFTGSVGLVLTRRCDMACPYCFIRRSENDQKSVPELPLERWLANIDALYRLKFRQVVFTGGEPTLYSGIVDLAEYARKRMLASIVSNGRFLIHDDPLAERLLPHIDLISLSDDAFWDSRKHLIEPELDKAARLLDSMGLNREMIITVTSRGIGEIPEKARMLGERGWSIRLSLVHRGVSRHPFRGTGADLAPGPGQAPELEEMVSSLESLRKSGLAIADTPDFLAGIPRFVRGERTMPCPVGLGVLEVDTDGSVQACQDCPSTGLTPAELGARPDRVELLRQSRLRACRCHYSHYYRHYGLRRKLRTARVRFGSLRIL